MIVVDFNHGQTNVMPSAMPYQWDRGQVLVMRGLPSAEGGSPWPSIEVHYGYKDEPNLYVRPAGYNPDRLYWVAEIPDSMFVRADPVYAYVYLHQGTDEENHLIAAETAYTATWTPISRPAPPNIVTEDQVPTIEYYLTELKNIHDTWTQIKDEYTNLQSQSDLASHWSKVKAEIVIVDTPDQAKVVIEDVSYPDGTFDYKKLTFYMPRGEAGVGLNIQGSYESFELLQQAHPSGNELGDTYIAGTHLYMWNGQQWVDLGQFRGDPGPAGPAGPEGPAGVTFRYESSNQTLYIDLTTQEGH